MKWGEVENWIILCMKWGQSKKGMLVKIYLETSKTLSNATQATPYPIYDGPNALMPHFLLPLLTP